MGKSETELYNNNIIHADLQMARLIEKYAIERPENYLQCSWTLSDDLSGLSQSSGRFVFA